jgi:flagellin-like hook-associated protein FlgL
MLVVTSNIMAMNAERQFNITNRKKEKTTEKLSSGYRINRAADDAAGLSISEKMRNQIRGLRQGCDNVDDGISLIKTADGAMSEMSSILHRMNELSVQAYNDTYSMEDRKSIQDEIDVLIDELQRTVDTTKFNGVPLLQGDRWVTKTYNEESVGNFTTTASFTIPSWLQVDDKMEHHSQYDSLLHADEGNEYMFAPDGYDQDGNKKYKYYGPKELTADEKNALGYGDFLNSEWQGAWSPALADNATVGLNLSGLTTITDADTLYKSLLDMLGTGVNIPCGSCDFNYGVTFSGTVGTTTYEPQYILGDSATERKSLKQQVDISKKPEFLDDQGNTINSFDAVSNLLAKHLTDSTLTDDVKQQQVQDLAKEIAKGLTSEIYSALKDVTSVEHFDRVIQNGDYEVVMYDFRDARAGADTSAQVVQRTFTKITDSAAHLLNEITVTEQDPLWIQHGANASEDTPIHLANASGVLSILNSNKNYSVARYQEIVTYSQEYLDKLKAWEANCVTEKIPHTATYTRKVQGPAESVYVPASVDNNGEITKGYNKFVMGEPRDETYTVTWTETTLKNLNGDPKPEPDPAKDVTYEYVYDPSSNVLIEDALKLLNSCRSQMGATQNRLEHIYDNNQNYLENLESSESNIRDTDMAKEMMNNAKENILAQAGQTMIAQANQQHSSVLNLLQ